MLNSCVVLLVEFLLSNQLQILYLRWLKILLIVSDTCANSFDESGWICYLKILVELEVDESQKGCVKFFKSTNNFIINIEWKSLIELEWSDPCNILSHNLNLIINTLNTEERLLKTLSDCAISHPFLI